MLQSNNDCNVQRSIKVRQVWHFFQIQFDHRITSSVIQMIRQTTTQPQYERKWNELCFFHCRCDGVNGDDENNHDDHNVNHNHEVPNPEEGRRVNDIEHRRNMDAIVQVSMACDAFRQLTIKGPAGDELVHNHRNTDNDNDNHNQGHRNNHRLQRRERRRRPPLREEDFVVVHVDEEEVLGQHAFVAIGMGLSFNQRLHVLQFSNMSLSTRQIVALTQGLRTSSCVLTQLVFSRITFATRSRTTRRNRRHARVINQEEEDDDDAEEDAIYQLGKGLQTNQLLHTLAVTSCKLTDTQISYLISGIQDHRSLKVLRLFGNTCRQKGAMAIAKLLSSSTCQLDSLDLHRQDDPTTLSSSSVGASMLARQLGRRLREILVPDPQQQFQQQLQIQLRQEEDPHVQLARQLLAPQIVGAPEEEANRNGNGQHNDGDDGGGGGPGGADDILWQWYNTLYTNNNNNNHHHHNNNNNEIHHRVPIDSMVVGLRGNQYLRRLNLSNNHLVDNDLGQLGQIVWTCAQLECLEVENNDFTVNGLEQFASCTIPSSLKTLRIQGNHRLLLSSSSSATSSGGGGGGSGGGSTGPDVLVKILQIHIRLETIDRDPFWTNSTQRQLIQHWMDVNRAGRRALLTANHNDDHQHSTSTSSSSSSSSSTTSIPNSLWPIILERANRIFHRWENRQANVIFHLLQGPVLLERHKDDDYNEDGVIRSNKVTRNNNITKRLRLDTEVDHPQNSCKKPKKA